MIRQTNRTARRAFPVVFVFGPTFLALRDRLVETFRQIRTAEGQPDRRLGLRIRFLALLLRQCLQPRELSQALG